MPNVEVYPQKYQWFGHRFFADVSRGFQKHQVWLNFAWEEILSRYRRSAFGLLWIVFGYAFFVGGVAFFFGGFAHANIGEFTIYVALGYAVFQFMIANVVDGCVVFTSAATWIKSTTLPYSIYVYKSIFRSLLPFGLHLLVVVAIFAYWRPPLTWNALWAIPAFLIFLINAVAIQYLCGLVSARFRDLEHLVGTISRILIFTTPILWVREERDGLIGIVADLNPLTHYVEIFRAPLMGEDVRILSYVVVGGLTIFCWLLAIFAANRMQKRLAFWV